MTIPDRNTLIYYFYSATPAAFAQAIQIPFLLSLGVELKDLAFLKSFGFLIQALLEFPIGVVSDRIPRKWVLAASSMVFLGSQAILIGLNGPSYPWLYLSEFLMILSASLYSGTKSAILADHLTATGRMEHFPWVHNNALAFQKVAATLFVACGAWTYVVFQYAPFLLNIAMMALGTGLILFFQESPCRREAERAMRPSLRPVFSEVGAIWPLIMTAGLAASAFTIIGMTFQVYLKQEYQIAFDRQTLIYQGYMLASLVGGYLVIPWIKRRRLILPLSMVLAGVGIAFLVLAFRIPVAATILILFLVRLAQGVQNIALLNEIHRACRRSDRATLLSFVSILENAVRAGFLFVTGVFLSNPRIRELYPILGFSYLVLFAPVPWLLKRRALDSTSGVERAAPSAYTVGV